jgi:hypothetical protein
MPDIAMCKDEDCPQKYDCYRYTAKPDFLQCYFEGKVRKDDLECDVFWANYESIKRLTAKKEAP